MTLYQAIERPLRSSHGKQEVSGSTPDVGLALSMRANRPRGRHGSRCQVWLRVAFPRVQRRRRESAAPAPG